MLYRYLRCDYAIEALQSASWKIGRILELNDPFDCQPILGQSKYKVGTVEYQHFSKQVFKEFNDILGVICYSGAIHDPVLWSHYAEQHKGIAFGFEFLEHDYPPMEVKYPSTDERAEIDYDIYKQSVNKLDAASLVEIINKGFLKKGKSWSYEKEYRHFIYLGDNGNELRGRNYFRGIPFACMREIILGANCTIGVLDIKRMLNKPMMMEHIVVREAVKDDLYYRINIK